MEKNELLFEGLKERFLIAFKASNGVDYFGVLVYENGLVKRKTFTGTNEIFGRLSKLKEATEILEARANRKFS